MRKKDLSIIQFSWHVVAVVVVVVVVVFLVVVVVVNDDEVVGMILFPTDDATRV